MVKQIVSIFFVVVLCCNYFNCLGANDDRLHDSLVTVLGSDIPDSIKIQIYFSETKRLKNNSPLVALNYANQALPLIQEAGDSLLLGLMHNRMGTIHLQLGNYDEATDHFLRNLKIQEYLNDVRRQGDVYNNLGILFKKQRDYTTAKQYYLKSLKLYRKADYKKHLAMLYNNLGVIYMHQAQYDTSIQFYNLAIEENKKRKNLEGLADNYLNLSNLCILKGDTTLATDYLFNAIKNQIESKHTHGELISLIQLAELYRLKNELSVADSVLSSVQMRANKIGYKPIEANAYFGLYTVAKNLKDSTKALVYLEKNQAIEDSLQSVSFTRKIEAYNDQLEKIQQSLKYRELLKLSQLNQAILEKESQNLYLTLIGLFALIILAAIILIVFLKERRISKIAMKQAEELEKQHDLLVKKNEDFLITISDLKEARREEDLLRGMIAHDLKSPIGQIQSLIELLTLEISPKTLQNEDVKTYLNTLELTFKRIDELIASIISAHKSSNKLKSSLELNALMENVIQRSKFQAQAKNIVIKTSLGMDYNLGKTDPEKLKRIIENIISNAIKFSPPASEIRVKTEVFSGGVVIEVIDNGPGFSKSGRIKLSEVIETNDAQPTGKEKSDKIGLAVVKHFCDDLGIRVIINSEKKAGTTFQLYLSNENR